MFRVKSLIAFCFVGVAGLLVAAAHQQPAAPQPDFHKLIYSVKGPELYQAYCASCHGADARGKGPASEAFKAHVPDLTMISNSNKGIFPAARVSKIITGEENVTAHGSRKMPVWGPIFHQVEVDQDWGYVRVQNLTTYLESIQKK